MKNVMAKRRLDGGLLTSDVVDVTRNMAPDATAAADDDVIHDASDMKVVLIANSRQSL